MDVSYWQNQIRKYYGPIFSFGLLIILFIYLFLSRLIVDPDSYFYLSFLKNDYVLQNSYWFTIIGWIKPFFLVHGLIFVKLIQVFSLIVSLFFINKMGRLVQNKMSFLPFLFLFPYFFVDFFRFENEIVAYPFLFASFYFIVSFSKRSSFFSLLLSLILFVISFLFWKATIFFFPVLFFFSPFLLSFLFPIVFFLRDSFYSLLDYFFGVPDRSLESSSFGALLPLSLFLPALASGSVFLLPFVFTVILAFFKYKFITFAVVFGALCIAELLVKEPVFDWLLVVAFFCMVFSFVGVFWATSNVLPLETAEIVVGLGKDLNRPVFSDWWLGYYLDYSGYPSLFNGGNYSPLDYNGFPSGVVWSARECSNVLYRNTDYWVCLKD